MRFSEAKKGKSLILIIVIIVISVILTLGFCQFNPTPKTVQKTIEFQAD